LQEKYFDALLTAAPDRMSRDVVLFADGEAVVEEARYVGTHTGPLRTPDGVEVPATGKRFDFPFVGIFGFQDSKIRSIRIYYDQLELLGQLGLMPGVTSA
jgi:predicted ester cyclase